MSDFIKKRWVLFLVLVVFIICKVPHLFSAYYWDESWPYAAAVRAMYHHGLTLMPGAIDTDLSRGHPLFFHFVAALWMNVFGASHFAMHSFALVISVVFLMAIYEAGMNLFNQRVAIISILLIGTLEAFFVQSSFLLLEVLVAFFTFLSLYFYVKGRYFLTALFLTLLFYTKESGLIMGFVLGADALIGLFNKNYEWKIGLQRIISIIVPAILIALFFLLQKHISGWYIFPMHSRIIEHRWLSIWFNLKNMCLDDTFHAHSNYYYFILLLILFLIAAIKNKNIKYLAVYLPAAFIYCLIDAAHLSRIFPPKAFLILFVCSIIFFIYSLNSLKFFANNSREKFMILACAFIFCFLCFSAVNLFTPRYLIAVFVLLFFFIAVIIDKIIERTYSLLYYPVLAAILVISYFAFHNDNSYGDTDMGAFQAMDVQQKEIAYLEQVNAYDKVIGCGGFLVNEHLSDPATGFLRSDKYFKHVSWYMNNNPDFVVFDNIEPDYRYDPVIKDSSYHLVYRYEKGKVWAEIYGRK